MADRTMGELTVMEHVRRASHELDGLERHFKEQHAVCDHEGVDFVTAYIASVEMSLAMIAMKLREAAELVGKTS